MSETWSTTVSAPTEQRAIQLADEAAADHFAGARYQRSATQLQHEQRDASGHLMFVSLLVIYTTE